jgi:hypothetical protein
MRWQTLLYSIAILTLVVGATLQSGEFLTAFGVKPNLILVLFAVFSFFIPRFFPYVLLVVLGGALLRFSSGFSWDIAALTIVGLLFYYVRDRFLSSGLIGSLVFIFLGTVLFYLLLAPSFVYHEGVVVVKELFYNGLLGIILFGATGFIYEKKGGSPIR